MKTYSQHVWRAIEYVCKFDPQPFSKKVAVFWKLLLLLEDWFKKLEEFQSLYTLKNVPFHASDLDELKYCNCCWKPTTLLKGVHSQHYCPIPYLWS